MPLLLLVLAGCGDDRALVDVPVSAAPSDAALTLDDGTAVALDTATVTIGDLRFQGHLHTAKQWSLIPTAYAHPGHGDGGEVAGELLGAWTLDLLSDPVALGDAQLYEGSLETASLALTEAHLTGTATVEGQALPFDLALPLDVDVAGVSFAADIDADAPPAGITLATDLAHALSFVDWAAADTDADGVVTVEDDDLTETTTFGATSAATWTLTLEP